MYTLIDPFQVDIVAVFQFDLAIAEIFQFIFLLMIDRTRVCLAPACDESGETCLSALPDAIYRCFFNYECISPFRERNFFLKTHIY